VFVLQPSSIRDARAMGIKCFIFRVFANVRRESGLRITDICLVLTNNAEFSYICTVITPNFTYEKGSAAL
jgi:hypothetical protein